MTLESNVIVIFRNEKGDEKTITITADELLDYTRDDLYDLLEGYAPCTSSGCNTESQNFCDCGLEFEDYVISGLVIQK
jgi:hypothetical protein